MLVAPKTATPEQGKFGWVIDQEGNKVELWEPGAGQQALGRSGEIEDELMPTKPLDRLMFAQGGLCFFCNMPLPKAEASVEHLVPSARAGSNTDDNCVACCKAVNGLFGSMSLKEKIRVVLNQGGKFVCPNGAGNVHAAPSKQSAIPTPPKVDNYAVVLADLKKRGPSRPRRVETLKNTIRATIKNAKGSISDAQLETLIKHLQVNGKITVDGMKVSYSL